MDTQPHAPMRLAAARVLFGGYGVTATAPDGRRGNRNTERTERKIIRVTEATELTVNELTLW